jgi:hypothetical protein
MSRKERKDGKEEIQRYSDPCVLCAAFFNCKGAQLPIIAPYNCQLSIAKFDFCNSALTCPMGGNKNSFP